VSILPHEKHCSIKSAAQSILPLSIQNWLGKIAPAVPLSHQAKFTLPFLEVTILVT